MKLKKMMQSARLVAALAMVSTSATAVTVGFTESFDADNSGWDDTIQAPANWVSSGGSDGGGYISTTFDYSGFVGFGGPVMFRATANDNPSGGAFIGDWNPQVSAVTAMVRHDAPVPLNFYGRVAIAPANFPGQVLNDVVPVLPGAWTEVTFLKSLNAPFCVGEGGPCSQGIYANVGNFQIGTDAPVALVDGPSASYTIDLDFVQIVPEPGTALLMGLGLVGLASSGRRERDAA